jgi:hypothetical protein
MLTNLSHVLAENTGFHEKGLRIRHFPLGMGVAASACTAVIAVAHGFRLIFKEFL